MPPIKHQQLGGSPEIELAEIHIPDDSNLGTGSFVTKFKLGEPSPSKTVTSIMINAPIFQISVTVNPNRQMAVLLGEAEGSEPRSREIFLLPVLDLTKPHAIRIEFSRWQIVAALLDEVRLGHAR
jgi:hypothetical protein